MERNKRHKLNPTKIQKNTKPFKARKYTQYQRKHTTQWIKKRWHCTNPGCHNNHGKGYASPGALHNHQYAKPSRPVVNTCQYIPKLQKSMTDQEKWERQFWDEETGEIILWKH
ncbi:MAG: hypothetical protein CL512_06500 [Actinobacteria bacterium]|nr:hypothetical protein [Actinomycetota bacterium]